jgi:hypothetical protein
MIWYGFAGALTPPTKSAELRRGGADPVPARAQSPAVRRFRIFLIALALGVIGIVTVGLLVAAARTDVTPLATQAWIRSLGCTLGQMPRHAPAATLNDDCAM